MLKHFRNKKIQKNIYLLLAIVILPPFVFWGVTVGDKESRGSSALGIIDSEKISLQRYLASYRAAQHEAQFLFGGNFDQARPQLNLKGEAWDRLLLLHEAKQRRIRTKDSEVVAWITRQPLFLSKDGRFNEHLYKLYVTQALRMNTRQFEEEIRELLTIQKFLEQEKTDEARKSLLEHLRGRLKIDLETMKKIFQENS